jgi:DNA-binding MurR/RpiR family transcriptional regulator
MIVFEVMKVIYDKMPIILLSKIASLPNDSINCRIASYILNHPDSVRTESISDLAKHCNVANSSVSRFCREIGLTDFFELREILEDARFEFERASQSATAEKRTREYANNLSGCLEAVTNSLDYEAIRELVTDIGNYENVTAFGLLKAETAAINLQADMLMLKKFINTKLAYDEQVNYINEADKRDLIIVFSYTGKYFVEGLRNIQRRKTKPRIYLISGNVSDDSSSLIYRKICFSSLQNQISHPYQLLFVSSIISQEYYHTQHLTPRSL